jgi:hypothetical protein
MAVKGKIALVGLAAAAGVTYYFMKEAKAEEAPPLAKPTPGGGPAGPLPGQIEEFGPVTDPLPLPEDVIAQTPDYTGPVDYVPGDIIQHDWDTNPDQFEEAGWGSEPETGDPYDPDRCQTLRSIAYHIIDYPYEYEPGYAKWEVIDPLINECAALDLAQDVEMAMVDWHGY